MNKKQYWNFFYKTQVNKIKLNHPSQFATFTVGETENITSLIEFGCGNGRDASFFSHHFKKVYAFDGSKEVIDKNKKQYLDDALMTSIAGISAAMKNTG